VHLTCRPVYGLRGWEANGAQVPGSLCRLGLGLHSETVFDACLFMTGDRLALLTASEDCSSRISLIRGGSLTASKLLPLQESGVRAVCSSRRSCHDAPTLAVVGGSKLTLQFFLVSDGQNFPTVKFLGYGRPPEKTTIDHRINTVSSAFLESQFEREDDIHLVASGDSNGSCYLYFVKESSTKTRLNVTGQLLYRDLRPIVSLTTIKISNRILLLVGTTGGDLKILEVPQYGKTESIGAPLVVLECKPHQMGTNCISGRVVERESVVRICSGGDDQSLFCCDVSVSSTPGVTARIVRSKIVQGAATSALRGICWCGDRHLVATGYDKQMKAWHLSDSFTLELVATEQVDVGDVNCLACCPSLGDNKCTVAVGGAGTELFSFSFS